MKISSKKEKPFGNWHASGVVLRDKRQIKTPEKEELDALDSPDHYEHLCDEISTCDICKDGYIPKKPPYTKNKDKKNWCKGKVGKEHILAWKFYNEIVKGRWIFFDRGKGGRISCTEKNWCALVCTRCYRILEWDRSGKTAKELRRKK